MTGLIGNTITHTYELSFKCSLVSSTIFKISCSVSHVPSSTLRTIITLRMIPKKIRYVLLAEAQHRRVHGATGLSAQWQIFMKSVFTRKKFNVFGH